VAERELAVVDFQNGYAGLIDAMRARAQERRIALSSADFAAVSGLPSYYCNKLLAANPVRRIGAISLGPQQLRQLGDIRRNPLRFIARAA
jgi:hypothetical protein